jgi:hypothetical protein
LLQFVDQVLQLPLIFFEEHLHDHPLGHREKPKYQTKSLLIRRGIQRLTSFTANFRFVSIFVPVIGAPPSADV